MSVGPETLPRREIVVVTGASTGIGAATARELARRGFQFHVLAGVRRDGDGDALRGTNIEPMLLDIADGAAVATLAGRIVDDPERRALRALRTGGPAS